MKKMVWFAVLVVFMVLACGAATAEPRWYERAVEIKTFAWGSGYFRTGTRSEDWEERQIQVNVYAEPNRNKRSG